MKANDTTNKRTIPQIHPPTDQTHTHHNTHTHCLKTTLNTHTHKNKQKMRDECTLNMHVHQNIDKVFIKKFRHLPHFYC